MLADADALQVLLMTISGLVNRHQADIVAYRACPGLPALWPKVGRPSAG